MPLIQSINICVYLKMLSMELKKKNKSLIPKLINWTSVLITHPEKEGTVTPGGQVRLVD